MKKNFVSVLALLFCSSLFAQISYWQQQVDFAISVALHDNDHTLTAFETVTYTNHSPDTLRFIWFHLWPNAYKNDRTAFSEQLLQQKRTDFYFASPAQKGYINQLEFKADGAVVNVENDSTNMDIIKVWLPRALAPGGTTIITTPFKVKLPYNISRGGHVGKDYQVTQWFPKPAVYDQLGWHPMPYLDQGEYYSDFGSYDVEITVPAAYVVAATGLLQDSSGLQQLNQINRPTSATATQTWHYKQDQIHDFAWFASKDFIVSHDTTRLQTGKVIDLFAYYKPKANGWSKSLQYVKEALHSYSNWLGEYPFATASIVQGSESVNSGGMEYPTIALITVPDSGRDLAITIAHEIGHNWLQGALASNERDHPWMDEGLNTFYEKRYTDEKYGEEIPKGAFATKLPATEEQLVLNTMISLHKDQPIETTSADFTAINYGVVAYYKTAEWLQLLQHQAGREAFDAAMRSYYENWRFKHPQPADFKASLEASLHQNLDDQFALLQQAGPLHPQKPKSIKPSFLFNLSQTDKYNYVSFAPAVGYNVYDKAMIGGMVHNLQLPLNKFLFAGGLLYATGSKKMNGFGTASYNLYERYYDFSAGLSYISYSQNDFAIGDGSRLIMGVKRWVPSATFTFFDKNVHATRLYTLQWKTFLINEGMLDFKTVIAPPDTFDVVGVKNVSSYINRLSFSLTDNRVLYPYSLSLSADQGKDFVRAGLTAKLLFQLCRWQNRVKRQVVCGQVFLPTSGY